MILFFYYVEHKNYILIPKQSKDMTNTKCKSVDLRCGHLYYGSSQALVFIMNVSNSMNLLIGLGRIIGILCLEILLKASMYF